jgi:group I intron endonuclease
VGAGVHTGIYKITNIKNNMCYVGQAANIAERWRQHIKRGIGAEAPTRNKLYPAMLSFGVENFTFEIVEECSRDSLNDREDYWQDYFHAKDFGYSIK